jgi:hypothetical protein
VYGESWHPAGHKSITTGAPARKRGTRYNAHMKSIRSYERGATIATDTRADLHEGDRVRVKETGRTGIIGATLTSSYGPFRTIVYDDGIGGHGEMDWNHDERELERI